MPKKILYAELILCNAPEDGTSAENQLGLIRDGNGQVIGIKIGDGITDWRDLESIYYTKDDIDAFLCQPITYRKLLSLRNLKQLKPGQYYRITDYQCIINEEMPDTVSSTNHKFDIIVQALSNATLSEDARVDYHFENGEPDGYFAIKTDNIYLESVAYIIEDTDGVESDSSQKSEDVFISYGYTTEDSTHVSIGTPFLLKTDIKNDPDEPDVNDIFYYEGTYEWEGVTYDKWRKIDPTFGWDKSVKRYALTELIIDDNNHFKDNIITALKLAIKARLPAWEIKYCLDNAPTKFAWASPFGTGVIYYMKDEWGNECPYDFKNILFNGNYTFQNVQADLDDASITGAAQNCIIGSRFAGGPSMMLPHNTIIISTNCENIVIEKNNANILMHVEGARNITVKSGLYNKTIQTPSGASNIVYKPESYAEEIVIAE